MDAATSTHWTRVRTLGRGASGAVVWLAADEASGEFFAVKSAGADGAAQLRREGSILSGLYSPHVLPCLGFRAAVGGACELVLEYAPGGSLADVVARSGARLEELSIRAYAADVVRGLAYLHGRSLVHGDVKGRNVLIGADGRAKLADFGCARSVDSLKPVGGTPAFMAPEVARGEDQGPAADVWALGCTVIEMATGRAPWSDMDDVVAAVHRIGYTETVPEVPAWLSPEAKDFLDGCLRRRPSERWTAAQLLQHPFVAPADCGKKTEEAKAKWVSPKSTLDAALWESETDDAAEETSDSTAERIRALAAPCRALPDWDLDEGWIEVCSKHEQVYDMAASSPAEEMAVVCADAYGDVTDAEAAAELFAADADGGYPARHVGAADAALEQLQNYLCSSSTSVPSVLDVNISDRGETIKSLLWSNCQFHTFTSVDAFCRLLVLFLFSTELTNLGSGFRITAPC